MFSVKTLQEILQAAGFYSGKIDGLVGPKTLAAGEHVLIAAGISKEVQSTWMNKWSLDRRRIAVAQAGLNVLSHGAGTVDGLLGPNTYDALEEFNKARLTGLQETWRDFIPNETHSNKWPLEANVEKFYGAPGTNHTTISLAYPMRLAWDLNTVVEKMTINEKCAESAERIFKEIASAYSSTLRERYGLDIWSGTYNNRNKRGGKSKSMHAYACAIDFDNQRNQLRWGRDRAMLAHPDCETFWKLWEAEGWISLGRKFNFDWMHVQAAVR